SVSLEHLHEEGAPWAKRADSEGQGRLPEVDRAGDVHGPLPAELRGHVAHDDVRRPTEPLEERRLDLRIAEVTAQELDALQRNEGAEIYCEHATGRPDPFPRDLRPSPRCGAQVHHDVAPLEQADPTVDLGQLDRRPAAVRLLLRRSVEAIVAAALDPTLAHRSERCLRASIILSSVAGFTC